eukprot:10852687-Prorocentrum_lima.AAC.1
MSAHLFSSLVDSEQWEMDLLELILLAKGKLHPPCDIFGCKHRMVFNNKHGTHMVPLGRQLRRFLLPYLYCSCVWGRCGSC